MPWLRAQAAKSPFCLPVGDAGADGLNSLKDGAYDVDIDAAKVHLLAVPSVTMAANLMATANGWICRSFEGDTGDILAFRAAFNKPAGGYQPFLDFNGDGAINTADNLQFRSGFNKSLSWRA